MGYLREKEKTKFSRRINCVSMRNNWDFWFATEMNPRFLLIEIEGKLGTHHMRISLDLSKKT